MKNKLLSNKASSPRNVVGDLRLTELLSLSRHSVRGPRVQGRYKEKTTLLNRLDPGYPAGRPSGMTTTDKNVGQRANLYACKAFTLIELLVVVLIIGILAAVAVPQYQKAVEKARLSEAFILGKHIRESEEMYYLANGSYTINFEDLGVETPSGYTLAKDRLIKGDNVFHLENGINRRVIYYYGSTAKNNQHLAIFFWYKNGSYKGKIQCHPYTAHGTELCATLQY